MHTFHFLQFLHRHRIMDEISDVSQKKTTVKEIYSKFVFFWLFLDTQVKHVRQELIGSNWFPANSGRRIPKPVPQPVSCVVPDDSWLQTRYRIRPSFPTGIPITDPVKYPPGQDMGNTPSFPLRFPCEKISRVVRL
jgi:hypothetical protein